MALLRAKKVIIEGNGYVQKTMFVYDGLEMMTCQLVRRTSPQAARKGNR